MRGDKMEKIMCEDQEMKMRELCLFLEKDEAGVKQLIKDSREAGSFFHNGYVFEIVGVKKKKNTPNPDHGNRKVVVTDIVNLKYKPLQGVTIIKFKVKEQVLTPLKTCEIFGIKKSTLDKIIQGKQSFKLNNIKVEVLRIPKSGYNYEVKYPDNTTEMFYSVNSIYKATGVSWGTIKKRANTDDYTWFNRGIRIKKVKP